MKDEIKEIMDNMREWSVEGNLYFEINDEKAKLLYDYITNLQEENERLRKVIKDNTILVKDENGDYKELNINPLDLQDRIDKAVEYIEDFYDRNEEVIEAFNFEYSYKHIISLLQGKSDE